MTLTRRITKAQSSATACNATLEIKTEQGSLRGVHLCAPGERLERVIDGDSPDDHRGGLEYNGARLEHADKIQ